MTVLYVIAKFSELGFERRERTGLKTLDRRVCENRKEKTSFVFVYRNISGTCLSFAAESSVKIKGIC